MSDIIQADQEATPKKFDPDDAMLKGIQTMKDEEGVVGALYAIAWSINKSTEASREQTSQLLALTQRVELMQAALNGGGTWGGANIAQKLEDIKNALTRTHSGHFNLT